VGQLPGTWCEIKRPNLPPDTDPDKKVRCACGRRLSLKVVDLGDGELKITLPPHKTKPRRPRMARRADRGSRMTPRR